MTGNNPTWPLAAVILSASLNALKSEVMHYHLLVNEAWT